MIWLETTLFSLSNKLAIFIMHVEIFEFCFFLLLPLRKNPIKAVQKVQGISQGPRTVLTKFFSKKISCRG